MVPSLVPRALALAALPKLCNGRLAQPRMSHGFCTWDNSQLPGSRRDFARQARQLVARAGPQGVPLDEFWIKYRSMYAAPKDHKFPRGYVAKVFEQDFLPGPGKKAAAGNKNKARALRPGSKVPLSAHRPDTSLLTILRSQGHSLTSFLTTLPGIELTVCEYTGSVRHRETLCVKKASGTAAKRRQPGPGTKGRK